MSGSARRTFGPVAVAGNVLLAASTATRSLVEDPLTFGVQLRDWEPFAWTVPSKLYEALATGKHVTAILAGEAADIVRSTGAGDVVAPGDDSGQVAAAS